MKLHHLLPLSLLSLSLSHAPLATAAPSTDISPSVYAPPPTFSTRDGRGDEGLPGWVDPGERGGSMLDLVANGLREPINVVISGHSDPHVLSEAGLRDYVRTIGFSFECLDLHLGGLQRADLGDGNGWVAEQFEFRQARSAGRWVGACWESFNGGNHFRAWKQNGTLANTGAWFLAVSKEKNLRHHHTIDDDGYDAGRDLLVESALKGGTWSIWKWRANVEWVEGLIEPGAHGINHAIAQDGRVAVLTVDRVINIPLLDSMSFPAPFMLDNLLQRLANLAQVLVLWR